MHQKHHGTHGEINNDDVCNSNGNGGDSGNIVGEDLDSFEKSKRLSVEEGEDGGTNKVPKFLGFHQVLSKETTDVDWSKEINDDVCNSNGSEGESIRNHQPNSHAKKGWEPFTDAVIKTISRKREGVVFLLWGNSAREKSRLIDETKHHILKAAHPSGLSANRGFFGCRLATLIWSAHQLLMMTSILCMHGKPIRSPSVFIHGAARVLNC
ncbi:hypothetical protein Q3G72_004371 [Acer saccharum]|nr:hypothetical protein Q3G72_004371 [Acer saccharum]